MEENKTKPEKKKTLTFNQIRVNSMMRMTKNFNENENLSVGDSHKKAQIIDSYLYGGNFKRGNKYKGDDKLILRHLPSSRKITKKKEKKTSILNKVN
jgi:hypothetical protein